MTLLPLTRSDAIFGAPGDESSAYRYVLTRTWGSAPTMAVIGVNPSTATATEDDPTIRRCIRFARDSGHGGLVMLNCFALRATDVRELSRHPAPIGETVARWDFGGVNVRHVHEQARRAGTVVCAWGSRAKLPKSWQRWPDELATRLRAEGVRLHVLRLTKAGDPEHPLYLPAECRPVEWTP
jgi:hypothetical protein